MKILGSDARPVARKGTEGGKDSPQGVNFFPGGDILKCIKARIIFDLPSGG